MRISVYFYLFVTRLQRGKKQQIENGSGAEDNGDSSHCSNASTHSNQEAGPSNKRTKTSDDSGLELDNNNTTVAIDPVLDGASEIELVFRPHPTLMENDDSAQTRYMALFFFVYSGLIPAVSIFYLELVGAFKNQFALVEPPWFNIRTLLIAGQIDATAQLVSVQCYRNKLF